MTMTLADLETTREGWDFEAKNAHGKDGTGAVLAPNDEEDGAERHLRACDHGSLRW